jgi:hypothetical protein
MTPLPDRGGLSPAESQVGIARDREGSASLVMLMLARAGSGVGGAGWRDLSATICGNQAYHFTIMAPFSHR